MTYFLSFIILGFCWVILLWFFWEFFYFFDLLSHFYFLYNIVGIILFCIAIFKKDIFSIFLSFLLNVFLLFQISHAEVFIWRYEWNADIFYLNSHYFVDESQAILDEIERVKAKYVMIVEINEELHKHLSETFRYHVYHSDRALSMWWYSNETLKSAKLHKWSYPFLEVQTREFSALLVHPLPPFTAELSRMQQQNFWEIKNVYNTLEWNKKLIVWDFNSSYFSQQFQRYFWDMYYKPIYSWGWLGPLRMPIDYAMWNNSYFEVHSTNLEVSDHLPLLIELH